MMRPLYVSMFQLDYIDRIFFGWFALAEIYTMLVMFIVDDLFCNLNEGPFSLWLNCKMAKCLRDKSTYSAKCDCVHHAFVNECPSFHRNINDT